MSKLDLKIVRHRKEHIELAYGQPMLYAPNKLASFINIGERRKTKADYWFYQYSNKVLRLFGWNFVSSFRREDFVYELVETVVLSRTYKHMIKRKPIRWTGKI